MCFFFNASFSAFFSAFESHPNLPKLLHGRNGGVVSDDIGLQIEAFHRRKELQCLLPFSCRCAGSEGNCQVAIVWMCTL